MVHTGAALFVEMGTIRVCCTSTTSRERARGPGRRVTRQLPLAGDAKAMLLVGDLNALNDEAKWDRLDAIRGRTAGRRPGLDGARRGAHVFGNGWSTE